MANDILEGMQKKVVVAYFKYHHGIHMEGLRKTSG